MPWSVTLTSTAPVRWRTATATRVCSGLYATAFSSRLASAVTSWLSLPQHLQAALAADDEGDAAGGGRGPGAVDGLRHHASTATSSGSGSGSAPCSRDRSMSSCTSRREPFRLVLDPAGEAAHGRRVVAGVLQRLGQQRHRADRRLELVADVGDEVAPDRLDPAGLRDVLDEQGDVPGSADRGQPDAHGLRHPAQPRGGQLELGLVRRAAAAGVAHQPAQLGHRDPVLAHDSQAQRRVVGEHHVVLAVEDGDRDRQRVRSPRRRRAPPGRAARRRAGRRRAGSAGLRAARGRRRALPRPGRCPRPAPPRPRC